jgi:hypothetical protein
MNKPKDWETFSSYILTAFIHELNVWNANQAISDAAHKAHYKTEIEPLVQRRAKLIQEWVTQ